MFSDRPCIDVCHSHISISSTVTVAFLMQSFRSECCHYTVIATVLLPQGNYGSGSPQCFLGEMAAKLTGQQEKAGFIWNIMAEICKKKVFVVR